MRLVALLVLVAACGDDAAQAPDAPAAADAPRRDLQALQAATQGP